MLICSSQLSLHHGKFSAQYLTNLDQSHAQMMEYAAITYLLRCSVLPTLIIFRGLIVQVRSEAERSRYWEWTAAQNVLL